VQYLLISAWSLHMPSGYVIWNWRLSFIHEMPCNEVCPPRVWVIYCPFQCRYPPPPPPSSYSFSGPLVWWYVLHIFLWVLVVLLSFVNYIFYPKVLTNFLISAITISLNAVCIFGLPVVFFVTPLPRYLTSGLWPNDTFQVIYFTVHLKI